MLSLILSKTNVALDRLDIVIDASFQRIECLSWSGPSLIYQSGSRLLRHILRLLKNREDMSGPAVLSEMRGYGVQHYKLSLDEFQEKEGVHVLGAFTNQIVLLCCLDLEKPVLKSLLISDFIICFGGVLNGIT